MTKKIDPWIVKTQSQIAAFFDVSLQCVGLWRSAGMPGSPKNYDLSKILIWLRTSGPWKEKISRRIFDDADSDGENLTDKARLLRAQADLKEMEVDTMAKTLIRLSDIQPNLDRLADALRNLGDNFRRSPMPLSGNDVADRINNMIENCEWNVT